jgi:hypothetical protein
LLQSSASNINHPQPCLTILDRLQTIITNSKHQSEKSPKPASMEILLDDQLREEPQKLASVVELEK